MSPRPAAVATAFLESTRAEDRFVEGQLGELLVFPSRLLEVHVKDERSLGNMFLF